MNRNKNSWLLSFFLGMIYSLGVLPYAVNAIEFPTISERKSPKSTAAGGQRGDCIIGNLPVTAFTPGDDNYIKTVSSQPQLFVYLPKTDAKVVKFAQFILKKNNEQNIIYIKKITITKGDYITKINLPDIETNQKYQWKILLICDNPENLIKKSEYTQGTIEKVQLEPEINTQISENKDILTKAEIYASQGIWSETLSLVFSLKDSLPGEWNELLTSVGLQDYLNKDLQQPECQENKNRKSSIITPSIR